MIIAEKNFFNGIVTPNYTLEKIQQNIVQLSQKLNSNQIYYSLITKLHDLLLSYDMKLSNIPHKNDGTNEVQSVQIEKLQEENKKLNEELNNITIRLGTYESKMSVEYDNLYKAEVEKLKKINSNSQAEIIFLNKKLEKKKLKIRSFNKRFNAVVDTSKEHISTQTLDFVIPSIITTQEKGQTILSAYRA